MVRERREGVHWESRWSNVTQECSSANVEASPRESPRVSLRRGREVMRPRWGEGARIRWVMLEGGSWSRKVVKVTGLVMV